MTNVLELVLKEREEQIAKGFDMKHDLQHDRGELALAASCYTLPEAFRDLRGFGPARWPFEPRSWKPSPENRKQELVKAAALLLAELERLFHKEAIIKVWETPAVALAYCHSTPDPELMVRRIAEHNLRVGEVAFATELLQQFQQESLPTFCPGGGFEPSPAIPEHLPPLPPPPEGYTHWIPRGMAWKSATPTMSTWANVQDKEPQWCRPVGDHITTGYKNLFYVEAVRLTKVRIPAGLPVKWSGGLKGEWGYEPHPTVFLIDPPPASDATLRAPGLGFAFAYGKGPVLVNPRYLHHLIPVAP